MKQIIDYCAVIKKTVDIGADDTLLLHHRNMAWLPAIKKNMAAQPTMIAVGCRHLLSGDGLIAILRREGYTVEPVK